MNKKTEKSLIFSFVIFCGGVALISLLYKNALLLTAILFLCWLIVLKFWHTKRDFYSFIIGAILGTCAEIIAVYSGAWRYTNPTVLNVPLWLPLAWGIGSMIIRRISETIIGQKSI